MQVAWQTHCRRLTANVLRNSFNSYALWHCVPVMCARFHALGFTQLSPVVCSRMFDARC
jgi:hypothetical protein